MSSADGAVLGVTKIEDNGSAAQRFNLVLVSEGYQAGEMAQFAGDALHTYFDAAYCNSGIRRLLECDADLVRRLIDAQVPEWHQILVLVNSAVYGGSGGTIATFAINGDWQQVALHEMGHAAFGFADEYDTWAGCGLDPAASHDRHAPTEPVQPNVTVNADPATIKWNALLAAGAPVAAMPNPDCTQCNRGPSPVADGTTGLFEGADYCHCGCYRPAYECRMRDIGFEFCAVCQDVIRRTIKPYLGS
jgi:hypothetical protein